MGSQYWVWYMDFCLCIKSMLSIDELIRILYCGRWGKCWMFCWGNRIWIWQMKSSKRYWIRSSCHSSLRVHLLYISASHFSLFYGLCGFCTPKEALVTDTEGGRHCYICSGWRSILIMLIMMWKSDLWRSRHKERWSHWPGGVAQSGYASSFFDEEHDASLPQVMTKIEREVRRQI